MASSITLLLFFFITINGKLFAKVITPQSQAEQGKVMNGFTEDEMPKIHERTMKPMLKQGMADFEKRVGEVAAQIASERGTGLKWYDLYCEQPAMLERPEYQEYQIQVTVEETKFSDPTNEETKSGFRYNRWYHNELNTELTSEFEKTAEVTNTYEWSMDTSVNVRVSSKIEVGVPSLFSSSYEYSVEFGVTESTTESSSETETYSIKDTINIPPESSVEATFLIEEKEMSIPWTSRIVIDGWFAVALSERVDGHWLWFYPISRVNNEEWPTSGGSIIGHAAGTFHGVRGFDSYLTLKQYPLYPNVTDQLPLKVTQYKQKPMMIPGKFD